MSTQSSTTSASETSSQLPCEGGGAGGPPANTSTVLSPLSSSTIAPSAYPAHSAASPHIHASSLSSISSSKLLEHASSHAPGGGLSRLNSGVSAFTPGKRVIIKTASGQEVDRNQFKKHGSTASSAVILGSPVRRTVPVRDETEEAKKRRSEEEEAEKGKKEAEKAKSEVEETAKRLEEEQRQGEMRCKEEGKGWQEEEERKREKEKKEEQRLRKEEDRLRKEAGIKAWKEREKRAAKEDKAKSALATVRVVENLGSAQYPEGVKSPKLELNVGAKQGQFCYDREFLLQFMAVCKEKPSALPPLDAIGLEPVNRSFGMTRGGSHGRRASSTAMPPPSRQASVGLGISGFNKPAVDLTTISRLSTPAQKMTSELRFAPSNRSTSLSSGPAGMPFSRPSPTIRSLSQSGPAHSNSSRTRSQRGKRWVEEHRSGDLSHSGGSYSQQPTVPVNLTPAASLEGSPAHLICKTPASLDLGCNSAERYSPEFVDRKVRALLNKLTAERFDSISGQVIAWANQSESENDGQTLIQVIRLTFEAAIDQEIFSEVYARLSRKMMEQISPNVRDEGIKNAEGKPIAGGQLFRKYFLNRCQEDFERGWVAKEVTATAALTKESQDQVVKAAAEQNRGGKEGENVFCDEYYAGQRARRQGLGLMRFIGELFKLQMLTERIMHECVKKLLANPENPEEEEIESLCKLLTTVGQTLDTPKARAHMDVYFSRMKGLVKSGNVNYRMQFMLQDVIELRERKWVPRHQLSAPTTLTAIREQVVKDKAS